MEKRLKETKKIRKLSTEKALQSTNIQLKMIKDNADIFGSYFCEFFNDCITKDIFPHILKHAKIMLVFKNKVYKGSKENYYPVSMSLVTSKTFEKLLCNQITLFMNQFLSEYQFGFRKGFSA